jgi:hypothetical protein
MLVARVGSLWQKVHPKVAGAVPPFFERMVGRDLVDMWMKLVLLSASIAFNVWQSPQIDPRSDTVLSKWAACTADPQANHPASPASRSTRTVFNDIATLFIRTPALFPMRDSGTVF